MANEDLYECENCGAPTDGAIFCENCAEQEDDGEQVCVECGEENDNGKAFCDVCQRMLDEENEEL